MGTMDYLFYYPELSTNQKFVKEYQALYKAPPGFPAFHAYTTAYLIAEAFRIAGKIDREKFIDAIEGLKVDTPVGKVEMRACDHQAVYPILFGTTKISKEFGAAIATDIITLRGRRSCPPARRSRPRASNSSMNLLCPPAGSGEGRANRLKGCCTHGNKPHPGRAHQSAAGGVEPGHDPLHCLIRAEFHSRVLRVPNVAHGSLYMIGAFAAHTIATAFDGSVAAFWLAMFCAPLIVAGISLIAERLLFCHLYEREHLMLLLFTFALMLILGDLTKMTWGADYRSIVAPPFLQGSIPVLGTAFPRYNLFLLLVGPLVAVGLWLISAKTKFGKIARAAAVDREMVGAIGINVSWVFAFAFVLGCLLAGLGGALVSPTISITLGMDHSIIIEAFLIVTIGGWATSGEPWWARSSSASLNPSGSWSCRSLQSFFPTWRWSSS